MSRLFIDGFENKRCSPFLWNSNWGNCNFTPRTGMSGSWCNRCDNATGYLTFDSNETELYLAFKINSTNYTYTNNGILEFRDSGGTTIAALRFAGLSDSTMNVRRGTYNGTGLASGGTIVINTTYLIEVHYKPLNSGGIFQVKVDGVQVIDYSGDTTAGLENVKSILWGTHGGVLGGYWYIDDLIIDDADWIGNTRVQKLQISGAGTTSEWDASAGNPQDCIDEIPYSDSDYVSTNVVNESLTCACADMTGNVDSVKCLEVYIRGAYEGSPTPTKQKIAIRVNGSEYYGSDISPALGYGFFGKRWEINPDDTAAWEEADINAIEIGVRSVT